MQTLAFLWYELKAAKYHVKESFAEPQQCGKADFSLLKKASNSEVNEERAPGRRHLSLRWTAKKEARAGGGPCLQGH
jgi:hypothetical protein